MQFGGYWVDSSDGHVYLVWCFSYFTQVSSTITILDYYILIRIM